MARKQQVPRTRPAQQVAPEGHRLYEIRINVLVNPDDLDALTSRVVDALCPDEHEGDCADPWSMITTDTRSYRQRVQRRMLEEIRTTNSPPG